MKATQRKSSISLLGDSIVRESIRRGSILSFAFTTLLAILVAYLVYFNFMTGWGAASIEYRQLVLNKEFENQKTERLLAGEDQFKAKFVKIVNLYEEAKPLLPEETEVSDVLGQVESAAQKNGVVLTGLLAVKESVRSRQAAQVYEREIPALVTGPYPQVINFFTEISRMPRILVVRDYSVISLGNSVSAGFTLVAYLAPPPAEKPKVPTNISSLIRREGNNARN